MQLDTLAVTLIFTFTLQEEIKVQGFITVFNDVMLILNFFKIGPAVLELKRVDISDIRAHSCILSLISRLANDE
jgi:hypothetical protein